jgi:phosphate transport system permease protein
MNPSMLLVLLFVLVLVAFRLGKDRSIAVVGGLRGVRDLHSLPGHYGLLTALWCGLPALAIFAIWVSFQDTVLVRLVLSHMAQSADQLSASQLSLLMNDLRNVVAGNVAAETVAESTRKAAEEYRALRDIAHMALTVIVVAVALGGLLLARARIRADLRARNAFERVVEVALFCCSGIAVLTTVGIVLSIIFEAVRFFNLIPIGEFLFGLHWSPQMAIRADQVFSIGTVNGTLQPIVRARRMQNVPQDGLWGFEPTSFFGAYMPDTFFYEGES